MEDSRLATWSLSSSMRSAIAKSRAAAALTKRQGTCRRAPWTRRRSLSVASVRGDALPSRGAPSPPVDAVDDAPPPANVSGVTLLHTLHRRHGARRARARVHPWPQGTCRRQL